MHFLMLVTKSMWDNATSSDTRWAVQSDLNEDDSFCGDGGRFGTPLCDWFVIGGRWSGLLANSLMGESFRATLTQRFPQLAQCWEPAILAKEHEAEFDAIWTESGGTGRCQYLRTHNDLGYEDDAMLLTQELYDAHLAKYGKTTIMSDGCHCKYVDLDADYLQPDFIGNKWLVVVDYHN